MAAGVLSRSAGMLSSQSLGQRGQKHTTADTTMAMEGNRYTVVVEYWMPLGDNRRAMSGNFTTDGIPHTRRTNSMKLHDSGAGSNYAAASGLVTHSDNSFHWAYLANKLIEIGTPLHPLSKNDLRESGELGPWRCPFSV